MILKLSWKHCCFLLLNSGPNWKSISPSLNQSVNQPMSQIMNPLINQISTRPTSPAMSSMRKASVWRTEKELEREREREKEREREREVESGSWGSGVAGLFPVTDTLHIQQELFDKRRSSAYRMEKILCQSHCTCISYHTLHFSRNDVWWGLSRITFTRITMYTYTVSAWPEAVI